MEESEKSRKIMSLQKHVHEVSENYYVLKGQQSSWMKNNKKTEYALRYVGARSASRSSGYSH
jgi:mannose-6-phosphate isomerase-like protein (cupin superfamily)